MASGGLISLGKNHNLTAELVVYPQIHHPRLIQHIPYRCRRIERIRRVLKQFEDSRRLCGSVFSLYRRGFGKVRLNSSVTMNLGSESLDFQSGTFCIIVSNFKASSLATSSCAVILMKTLEREKCSI